MLNRRGFIKNGSIAVVTMAGTDPVMAGSVIANRGHPCGLLIHDRGLDPTGAVRARAGANGVATNSISHDLTEGSYRLITEHFATGWSMVAGITRNTVTGYVFALARDYEYAPISKTEMMAVFRLVQLDGIVDVGRNEELVPWVVAPLRTSPQTAGVERRL